MSQRKFRANSGVKIPLEIKVGLGKEVAFLGSAFSSIGSFLKARKVILVLGLILTLLLIRILAKKILEYKKQRRDKDEDR